MEKYDQKYSVLNTQEQEFNYNLIQWYPCIKILFPKLMHSIKKYKNVYIEMNYKDFLFEHFNNKTS